MDISQQMMILTVANVVMLTINILVVLLVAGMTSGRAGAGRGRMWAGVGFLLFSGFGSLLWAVVFRIGPIARMLSHVPVAFYSLVPAVFSMIFLIIGTSLLITAVGKAASGTAPSAPPQAGPVPPYGYGYQPPAPPSH